MRMVSASAATRALASSAQGRLGRVQRAVALGATPLEGWKDADEACARAHAEIRELRAAVRRHLAEARAAAKEDGRRPSLEDYNAGVMAARGLA